MWLAAMGSEADHGVRGGMAAFELSYPSKGGRRSCRCRRFFSLWIALAEYRAACELGLLREADRCCVELSRALFDLILGMSLPLSPRFILMLRRGFAS